MMDLSQFTTTKHHHSPLHRYTLPWGEDTQGSPLHWCVEQEKPLETHIFVTDNTLTLESAKGLTLWLNKPLTNTYRISFTRKVLLAKQPYDRLSDVNMFWAANDPANANLFTRNGELSAYDDLNLFYTGIGGNWNTTSRFRYYDGNGKRQLLHEYTHPDRLLRADHPYHFAIEVASTVTRVLVDGEVWFSAQYRTPPPCGYFAFRTVWSRQQIKDFTVAQL